jgi:hypothetical protein
MSSRIEGDLLVSEGLCTINSPLCAQLFHPTHFASHFSLIMFSWSMTSLSSFESLVEMESFLASAIFPFKDDAFSSHSQVERLCS